MLWYGWSLTTITIACVLASLPCSFPSTSSKNSPLAGVAASDPGDTLRRLFPDALAQALLLGSEGSNDPHIWVSKCTPSRLYLGRRGPAGGERG
jgi:hypothetical protein